MSISILYKLQELGHLCSLMPGLMPTSEQLTLVVDLVSGMGDLEESLCKSLHFVS